MFTQSDLHWVLAVFLSLTHISSILYASSVRSLFMSASIFPTCVAWFFIFFCCSCSVDTFSLLHQQPELSSTLHQQGVFFSTAASDLIISVHLMVSRFHLSFSLIILHGSTEVGYARNIHWLQFLLRWNHLKERTRQCMYERMEHLCSSRLLSDLFSVEPPLMSPHSLRASQCFSSSYSARSKTI